MKKRVKIPKSSPALILDLAKRIQEKHNKEGEQSPLRMLNHIDINAEIDKAWEGHKKATELKRQTLAAFQQRSITLQPVLELVRCCRDALTARYSGEQMKELGRWGFDVFERRSAPKKKTSAEQEENL